MKYFYITLIQHDGEHEHNYNFLARGRSEKTVRGRIEREQLYDRCGKKPHRNSMLDYGDGTTAVSKYSLREIPSDHFDLMIINKYMQEV